MLDVEADASIPARYNVATFPEYRPMMMAVNSGDVKDGKVDFGAWFRENHLDVLEHLLDDTKMPATLSAQSERILRRCMVFKVEDFLLDVEPNTVSVRQSSVIELMKGRAGKF